MPITATLIPAADCVLLLHHLVIGPVTFTFNVMVFKCTHYTTCITLNVSQTGCTVASQLKAGTDYETVFCGTAATAATNMMFENLRKNACGTNCRRSWAELAFCCKECLCV